MIDAGPMSFMSLGRLLRPSTRERAHEMPIAITVESSPLVKQAEMSSDMGRRMMSSSKYARISDW
jgi:hypothetical protein